MLHTLTLALVGVVPGHEEACVLDITQAFIRYVIDRGQHNDTPHTTELARYVGGQNIAHRVGDEKQLVALSTSGGECLFGLGQPLLAPGGR